MGARLSRYAIHNAISPGGDSDTLAAITGSIAEAAYGIPQWFKDKAWPYFDEPLRDICNEVSGLKVQTNGQPILHRLAVRLFCIFFKFVLQVKDFLEHIPVVMPHLI